MAAGKTPGRWPYRGGLPLRRQRVIRDDLPRGVHALIERAPRIQITRLQARIAVAAALLLMLAAGGRWAYHSRFLTVSDVRVNGTAALSPDAVRAAAGIDGKSVFGLDLASAQARVAALPKVRSASVRKDGYNGVAIDIEERVTWGSWQISGVNVPIDADGYVMDTGPAPYGTPTIVEVEAQRVINSGDRLDPGAVQLAVRLVDEAPRVFGRNVTGFAYRQNGGLTAVLSGTPDSERPLWVTFGDIRDYDYKVAALDGLLVRAKDDDIALTSVDLRFGDRLSFN